jgi:hypothetical protein
MSDHPQNPAPPAELAEQLTITVHAIANFKSRANIFSVVGTVGKPTPA